MFGKLCKRHGCDETKVFVFVECIFFKVTKIHLMTDYKHRGVVVNHKVCQAFETSDSNNDINATIRLIIQ